VSIVPWLDIAAASVLLVRSFININRMHWGTKHCYRVLNVGIAVAALAVIFTAFKDGDTRYYAHVLITCAMAVLVVLGRREADKLSA